MRFSFQYILVNTQVRPFSPFNLSIFAISFLFNKSFLDFVVSRFSCLSDAVAIVVDANGSKINRIETETMYELPSWNVIHKKYFDEQDVGIGKEFELCCIRHGWHHMDAGKVMGKASYGPSDCYRVQKRWEARALELAKLTDKIICQGVEED